MHTFIAPFGKLTIQLHEQKISKICFISNNQNFPNPPKKIDSELQQYFQNPNHQFNLELHIEGTPFQQSVWQALRTIPRGTTLTYKALAERLNTSPRAIGNACRANPIPLVIPCHRIVAQKGLGGFAGDTSGKLLEIKKWLLQHEGL